MSELLKLRKVNCKLNVKICYLLSLNYCEIQLKSMDYKNVEFNQLLKLKFKRNHWSNLMFELKNSFKFISFQNYQLIAFELPIFKYKLTTNQLLLSYCHLVKFLLLLFVEILLSLSKIWIRSYLKPLLSPLLPKILCLFRLKQQYFDYLKIYRWQLNRSKKNHFIESSNLTLDPSV